MPWRDVGGSSTVAVPIDVEVTMKANGNRITALEVHLWTFGDDGKVTRFFHAIDRHAFVLGYEG